MNDEQEKSWDKAERASHKERKLLLETTRDDLVALLGKARDDIILKLASTPTDFQLWHLPELLKEIERVLDELSNSCGRTIGQAANAAWEGGIAAIDRPLLATRFEAATLLPRLEKTQLKAMGDFMIERITNISTVAASKIRMEIGLAGIGSQSIHDTMVHVTEVLGKSSKDRATTIVRTELGRVWAYASHERALQSSRIGVEMDKIWRRSGKKMSRLTHDLADGQRVPVHQAFTVGTVKIRFPHDPKAPAAEVINCGCIALYRPRKIDGTLPDSRAFTTEEINANPYKADLEELRKQRVAAGG